MYRTTTFPVITSIIGMLLFLSIHTMAQTFQTSIGYGAPTNERGASGVITPNGNYLILADNVNHPGGLFNPAGDMELLRLDNLGNLLLPSRIVGQDVKESATWIENANDCNGTPGFIIAGNETQGGLHNMLLTYVNSGGLPQWVRRIGTLPNDETSACVKQDGGRNFVLVGTQIDANTGMSSVHVVKTDCNGSLLWERVYRLNGSATARSVTTFATFQTTCGANLPNEYFITGSLLPASGADEAVFILAVNASTGNVSWMKSYDVVPNAADQGSCIQGRCAGSAPGNAQLWISGQSNDNSGTKNVLMMQTNIAGNVLWANTYDIQNSPEEWATHFQFAANKKLIVTGKAEASSGGSNLENGHCLLMLLEENGLSIDWTHVFTNAQASQGNRVEPNTVSEYFVTGYTMQANPQPDYNVLAIKTDPLGETKTTCYHIPENIPTARQPVVVVEQPMPFIPQDFFPSSLQTALIDDKQTFCPATPIDPCDTLGLAASFTFTGSGNTLSFTDLSTVSSGGIFSWNWDFGDAGTSTMQNPVHTYASSGVYTVCLIITGGNAGVLCRDTVCKEILVPFQQSDSCEGNIVLNGNFTQGLAPGNLGSGGTVSNWATWTASPQVITFDNCQDPGAIQMWGNQVVGESITQPVSFVAGGVYQVTFCGKWLNTVQGNVQMRFRASQGFPGSYLNCSGTCDEIFLSPVMNTTWTTYTSAPWTATQNYNTLTISVWNNFAINDGAYVSWSRIDDVCIRRIGTTATHELPSLSAQLMPNPTSGDVSVRFAQPVEAETQVVVMDLTGKKVQEMMAQAGDMTLSLDLSRCPSGMYMACAMQQGRIVWREKVVKQ